MSDEDLTFAEFAALCRERCSRPAQRDGFRCGDQTDIDGEPSWTFCGFHMSAVLGGDE